MSSLDSGSGNDTIAVTTPFGVFLDGGEGNDSLSGGTGDDNLNGENGNDSLSGGMGNDSLSGDVGNDTLTGGLGTDMFLFYTEAAFTTSDVGVDLITNDFVSGTDKIVLGYFTFSTLNITADGVLSASDFATINTGLANELSLAGGSSAEIVYNQFNGNLFYNQNGSITGLGTGGLFATLTGIPSLAATDFIVQDQTQV